MTDTSPAAIAAILDGVTEGPWAWQVSTVSKSVELTGGRQSKAGGDLTVMSFKRWGLQSAAPVFWTWAGNYATRVARADELLAPEPGREHHKNWFSRINHPDARFIAAARDLVPALAAELAASRARVAELEGAYARGVNDAADHVRVEAARLCDGMENADTALQFMNELADEIRALTMKEAGNA